MRLAFSQISTVNASFAEDVAAYAAAGFDAIGLWEMKLPADDDANRELLREHGLAVANCVPAVPSLLQLGIPGLAGPADPEERIAAICASVRRLAAYEPECVLCLSGPAGRLHEDEARAAVARGLRRIAGAAREAGVRLGLEPIHPAQRETTSFVNTVGDAVALLDQAGLADVGIMVDTFNLWDDGDAADWLRAHAHDRVSGVHVADRPGGDRSDRVLPGEAGTRTRELVAAAREGGWDGSLDVEIFSEPDRFWGLPVDEAARRAHAAAAALL
ncbi:MAG TPA: sugar phosphate isomerase/epimerase family protein [Gaiellaceae bacterium]|nr:sugar phosphate isomerase/epimerase family protein [Gaiellaceae bacterium]